MWGVVCIVYCVNTHNTLERALAHHSQTNRFQIILKYEECSTRSRLRTHSTQNHLLPIIRRSRRAPCPKIMKENNEGAGSAAKDPAHGAQTSQNSTDNAIDSNQSIASNQSNITFSDLEADMERSDAEYFSSKKVNR